MTERINALMQNIIFRSFSSYVFDTIRLANPGLRTIFGSLDQRITNVIYTNGYLDPMMYSGIIYTFDQNSFAHNIERKLLKECPKIILINSIFARCFQVG